MRLKTIFIIMLALTFLSSFPGLLSAEMREGAFSLNPNIGGYVFQDSQDSRNNLVYGLGAGYSFTKNWGIEGNFNLVDTETDDESDDVQAYIYRLDGLYHFMPDNKLVPFVTAGVGAINIHGGADDGADPLFNYGAGIKYFLNKSFAIRADIRHIITDDPKYNVMYTFGLTYMFGGKEKEVAPPPPAPVKEVAPPPPAPVKEVAPPPPAPVKEVAPPPPAPVKEVTPPPPVKETKVIVLDDIHFDFDMATLTKNAVNILNNNIKTLKENPGLRVRIEGHSCAHGPEDYNLRLSDRRANAVKEYLVNGGVSADSLTTITYGETRLAMPEVPTPDNKNSNEAKANRRVHFEVIIQ